MSRSITRTPAEMMIGDLAFAITAQLLQARRVFLKGREPRTQYQRDVRTGVSCGRSKPVEKLLAISLADLEDGAPLTAVLAAYESCIELLKARAGEIQKLGVEAPSLLGIIQRENRFEHGENDAENRALAAPDDIDALLDVLDASAREREAQDRRDAEIKRRIASLRSKVIPSLPSQARDTVLV